MREETKNVVLTTRYLFLQRYMFVEIFTDNPNNGCKCYSNCRK